MANRGNIRNLPRPDNAPVESKLQDLVPVTLHDTNTIDPTDCIYLPAAGTVKVTTGNATDRTLTLGAGYHDIEVTKVWLTGTTASLVVYAGYK